MRSWWRGTRLVAARGLVERLKSRSFAVVTGLLLLLSMASVAAPQVIGGGDTTYTLATVGKAAADVVTGLDAAGASSDFQVEYLARDDEKAVQDAVRDGDATAGLVNPEAGVATPKLYSSTTGSSTFPAAVSQVVTGLEISRRLSEAGLSSQQIAEIQSVQPPEQVLVGPADNEARAFVGFGVGIVLYAALVFAGSAIATSVAMEKSTRISEVLLAVLRPSQVLVGTVIAVGAATLLQLLVLAAPIGVSVLVTGTGGLPSAAAGDIALAVAWFALGFGLYAFLFAAAAALVDKITEVSTAITPVIVVLVAGYVLAVTVVMANPSGVWSVAASLFPLSAPMAMPIRWASGAVPIYQLILAMALTAAASVLLVVISSSIYRRALVITGRRVKLREVIGGRAVSRPGR